MEIKTIEISGFATALKGLRLPFKKESRSDIDCNLVLHQSKDLDLNIEIYMPSGVITINNKDLNLLQALIKKGNDHSKVMRFVNVSAEIKAPLFWWSEYDTYKVGTTAISESTMHTILNTDKLTFEHFENGDKGIDGACINHTNDVLRIAKQTKNKELIKAHLPSGYLQTRIIQTNYQALRNIYFQRKNHELSQWRIVFSNWIKTLPLSNDLITIEK